MMTATNINIGLGGELEARAQSVLADLGLDVPTAINIFLTRVIEKNALPFAFPSETDVEEPATKKIPFSELRGCFKGQIWMADDFHPISGQKAPLFLLSVIRAKLNS